MTAIPPSPPQEPQELPIAQILSIFWRGRWIILASTVLATVAGFFYVEARGTIYRAQSRVYVEKKGPNSLGAESLLLGMGAKNYANTQAEVMQSGEILKNAASKFRDYYPRPQLFAEATNEVSWLKKALSVKVGRDDDIITVSLDSNLKDEACEIVNQVVEAYQKFQENKQKKTVIGLYGALSRDRDTAQALYDKAMDAITDYQNANPDVGAEQNSVSVLRDTWQRQSTALAAANDRLREAANAYEAAKDLQADPATLRQVLPSLLGQGSTVATPSATAMNAQIFDLQRQKADLLLQLSPDHPRIQNIDKAVAELKASLAEQDVQFAKAFVEGLHQRYLSCRQRCDQLATAASELEAQVAALRGKETQYMKLLALADQQRESMSSATEILKKINPSAESDIEMVNVLDVANPETAEVASGKPLRLAASLLLGLFLGAALAWLRGLMDQRIRAPEEVRTGLKLPLLAVLPKASKVAEQQGGTTVARWDNDAGYAEAARSLRTAVYFGMASGEGNKVQITSPDAADGKTTIAGNLAVAMAKAGQRTLLIDADLRKPRQHERFGLSNENGLSTVLASELPAAQAVQRTELDNLDVLTSGPVPANPAEILNSQKFGRVLAELGKKYDRVIVDSPPVLPVADARIIASRCDTTLLTLRVDKSTRKHAEAARDMLVGVGAKILGVAMNDMPSALGYGYGRSYGYGTYAAKPGRRIVVKEEV